MKEKPLVLFLFVFLFPFLVMAILSLYSERVRAWLPAFAIKECFATEDIYASHTIVTSEFFLCCLGFFYATIIIGLYQLRGV